MGIFNKAKKWVKRQTHGGISARGLKSSVKGAFKPKNLGWTLGALTLGATALPGVSLGGIGHGIKSGLGKLIPGGGAPDATDAAVDATLKTLPSSVAQPSRFRRVLSGAGKFFGGSDGFGVDDVLKLGSAAGDAYGAYDRANRLGELTDLARDDYAARAPLRQAGMNALLDDTEPDRRYRRVVVGSRV